MAGLAFLCLFLLSAVKDFGGSSGDGQDARTDSTLGEELLRSLAREAGNALYRQFVPAFSFVQEETEASGILQSQIGSLMPLYRYAENYGYTGNGQSGLLRGESMSLEDILMQENGGAIPEETGQEEAGAPEGAHAGVEGETGNMEESAGGQAGAGEEAEPYEDETSLDELLRAENEAAIQASQALSGQENGAQFTPHTLLSPIDPVTLQDYETLVQNYYTIDANTMAGSDQLNAQKLLEKDMTLSKDSPGPQILIFHTHSQETFADSVEGDESTSIVGVGERLAGILTEEYGYQVLHHTGQYDVDTRDDAYSNALPAIEQVLKENPTIQVVIDLHRDQMPEETKLVMDLDGRPTARFMFFNGLSRTKKTGNISYLYNENQEDNLAFSFQMQMAAAQYYPGLTRKIYLKGYRYNMHLRPRYLLVELGAQNNTVEEAMNACDPLAHILDLVLSGSV